MLGAYLSFVLVKTQTLATVVINHGYMNFMGTPNFGDLLNGDIDYMKQSILFNKNIRNNKILYTRSNSIYYIMYHSFMIYILNIYHSNHSSKLYTINLINGLLSKNAI